MGTARRQEAFDDDALADDPTDLTPDLTVDEVGWEPPRYRGPLRTPPSRGGLVGAALLWLAGLAPSLLPRPPAIQIALAALLAAVGYGLGTVVSWLLLRLAPGLWRWRRAGTAVALAAWVLVAAMTAVAVGWQETQSRALGLTASAPTWWALVLDGAAAGWLLVVLARLLRSLARRVAHASRRFPRPVAELLGFTAAAAVVVGVVAVGFLGTRAVFTRLDATVSGTPPASTLRSGGPESLIPWDTLGAEGRRFVTGGPTTAGLDTFGSRTAVEPIRIFVGLASAPTPQERAQLAVAELRRTGGLDRELVVALVPTGNGFVDPALVATPEYVAAGDIATVATQYSVLPSWLSYLVDQRAARDEGIALVSALREAVARRPEGQRPRLVVAGESLGAYGAQAPFDGLSPAEVAGQVDGAVFYGSPSGSALWQSWRLGRSGGPEWEPIIGDGAVARAAATAATIPSPTVDGWGDHRVLLVSHANDAVAWWGWPLAWSRPGWLDDPRGPGTDPRMTWWPLVFVLQVGLDLATAGAQPPGIGHDYLDSVAAGWVAVLQPEGWTAADTTRLTQRLTSP